MSVWVALALTWAAIGLVAWRVRRLEWSGGPTSPVRKFSAPAKPAWLEPPPPNRSGMRLALKRTWGDPPPLPAFPILPTEDALHPLPPVPTEQLYRARTRVWRP